MAQALSNQTREKQCGNKVKWPGELPARNVAIVMTWLDEEGITVEEYPCRWCESYHVGHARYRKEQ